MEDVSINGNESLVRPRQEVVEERENEKRQKLVEGEDQDQDQDSTNKINNNEGGGGILDNLLSKLSSPRTPKPIDVEVFDSNYTLDANHHQEAPTSDGSTGTGSGSGGGVFNKLVSNFFSNNSNDNGHNGHNGEGALEKSGEDIVTRSETHDNGNGNGNGDGRGVGFNKLVSNFFHKEGEEKKQGEEEHEGEMVKKVDQENEGGKSIITNLVPDDAAPASDEASMLIHSVVHD